MLHVLWLVIVQRTVRRLLLPGLDPMDHSSSADNQANGNGEKWYNPLANVGTFALIAYILFVVFSSLFILTPLEVMTTRLTIQVRVRFIFSSNRLELIFFSQRNNEPGFSTVPQEESPDLEYAGRDEDVIALRPEDNPYEGLKHCGLSILQEEGYQALFRAWWVTAIGGVLTALT